MISAPAGNDLLYDESALDQGRNFCNKMWNAMKLVKGWEDRCDESIDIGASSFALEWMNARLQSASHEIAELFKDFRLSEGLKTIYSLVWDDFCSWYLEWIKPAQDQPISARVYRQTIDIYEQLLQLLHPYMPFITEDIYHNLRVRNVGDDLLIKQLPALPEANKQILKDGAFLQEVITAVRDTRNKNQLKPKETIKLWIDSKHHSFYNGVEEILRRQVNAENIGFTDEPRQGCISIVVQTDKLYIEAATATVDISVQKDQMQKELDYLKGFLISIDKKLGNEKFVQNAKPEVVAIEKKKQEDALSKIKAIEESLSLL